MAACGSGDQDQRHLELLQSWVTRVTIVTCCYPCDGTRTLHRDGISDSLALLTRSAMDGPCLSFGTPTRAQPPSVSFRRICPMGKSLASRGVFQMGRFVFSHWRARHGCLPVTTIKTPAVTSPTPIKTIREGASPRNGMLRMTDTAGASEPNTAARVAPRRRAASA